MKYTWEKYIFQPDDFNGAGQYIVREGMNKENRPDISDTSYLSTVMMKVGWFQHKRPDFYGTALCLIDMSDGLVKTGYFISKDENGKEIQESANWERIEFEGENTYEAQVKLCEYLNNNLHGNTYRKATNEELIRVAAHQKYRTK